MKKALVPVSLQVTVVALFILMLYLVALVYPDSWWGLHYPAFLGGKGWLIVVLAIGATLYGQKYSLGNALEMKSVGGNSWIWVIALTILAGIFYHQMPIYYDVYGDALKIIPSPDFMVSEFAYENELALKSFDFSNLKLGTDTTLSIVIWLSYSREIELQEAFRILGTACGMGYVFFMLAAAFRIAKSSLQRVLFSLLILGSPIVLNFCGHIEIYAPILFLMAVFWFTLIHFLERPSWFMGAVMVLVCFANLKFHIAGGLTFIIFGVAVAAWYLQSKGKQVTWRGFGAAVLGVFFAAGIFVYAFVTKSVFGTRSYTEENLTDAIFLPIKASDPAPLDRYNLFSWNHFFDYFNMMFLWSAVAVLIIGVALIFRRKTIRWNQPLILVSGIGTIFFVLVFFVLNPLLAMPVDWDLMSIPAITLIMFAIAIVSQGEERGVEQEEQSFTSYLIAPAAGLFLIGLTGIFVNANKETEADRMISCGTYCYKTYWIGASTLIKEGLKMQEDPEAQFEALDRAVKEMEPYAVQGNDIQYAAVLNLMGEYYQKVEGDLNEAHAWYLKSEAADKRLLANILSITQTHFVRKEFKEAHLHAENLIHNKFPNEIKSLRMGIHIALEVEEYETSVKYCQQLLSINPDDKFIQEILHLLTTSKDKSQIKLRFRQR